MKEDSKFVKWLKSINYKSSLVYFLVIQVIVFASSFFLPMPMSPLLRFIFTEENVAREIAEIVTMLVLELGIRLILFYAFFGNDRSLEFKTFTKNYGVTVILRLIISSIIYFAAWSAGITICLTGALLGKLWISEDIKTMQDVPYWLYLVVFVIFEALAYLMAYLANTFAKKRREKVRQDLINHKEQI